MFDVVKDYSQCEALAPLLYSIIKISLSSLSLILCFELAVSAKTHSLPTIFLSAMPFPILRSLPMLPLSHWSYALVLYAVMDVMLLFGRHLPSSQLFRYLFLLTHIVILIKPAIQPFVYVTNQHHTSSHSLKTSLSTDLQNMSNGIVVFARVLS